MIAQFIVYDHVSAYYYYHVLIFSLLQVLTVLLLNMHVYGINAQQENVTTRPISDPSQGARSVQENVLIAAKP